MQPYPSTPGPGMPQYSREWQGSDLEGTVAPTSDSYLEQPVISDYPYPQSVQPEGMKPDTSFRDTLRDIEYTFYKTFPAAAHAAQSNQSWGVVEDVECSQDRVMYFYPSSGATIDCSAPNSLSSGPAAFASAPSGRARVASDVDMSSSIHAALQYHPAPQSSLSPSSPTPVVHHGHPTAPISQSSASLHASTSTLSPISDRSSVGSLSEACRFRSTPNSGQSNYGQPYVTSKVEDDGEVPPMASLMCPAKIAPSTSSALVKTSPSPLPCQYPSQTIPRAINIPPSPHSMSTGYLCPSTSNPSTPNQQIDGNSPDPSSSPPSITLYPVPQAPVNYTAVPPWPPHLISEPVPHPPSGRESSSARRRKKNKDNDKKPPLACLFCRGRKIACGAPSPDGDGKTCNQCARRGQKCDYPAESRRGMRKDKSLAANSNSDGGAKGIVKTKKRS